MVGIWRLRVRVVIQALCTGERGGSLHLIDLLLVKQLSLTHETLIHKVVILDAGEGAGGVWKGVW